MMNKRWLSSYCQPSRLMNRKIHLRIRSIPKHLRVKAPPLKREMTIESLPFK